MTDGTNITGDLDITVPWGTLVMKKDGSGTLAKIGRMVSRTKDKFEAAPQTRPSYLYTGGDGRIYRRWSYLPEGTIIGNDQTISVGSFATYSSIRLVIPDGLIFSPMLAGKTDARVLAELRLPSPDVTQIRSAQYDGTRTETALKMDEAVVPYGDVIWNSSSSKQYLPVTSDNPIYRLNVECRLVPRDPTVEPKVLKLGFNDLLEVKLRLLQLH